MSPYQEAYVCRSGSTIARSPAPGLTPGFVSWQGLPSYLGSRFRVAQRLRYTGKDSVEWDWSSQAPVAAAPALLEARGYSEEICAGLVVLCIEELAEIRGWRPGAAG